MDKNCINLMTRRIAIAYMKEEYNNPKLSDSFEYLDYLIGLLRDNITESTIDSVKYSDDDCFRLSGLDIGERYGYEIAGNEKPYLEAYPTKDLGLFTDFLEVAVYKHTDMTIYNGLSEDLLRKCMFMKNHAPSSTYAYANNVILTGEDILKLPEPVLLDCISTIQDYDIVHHFYNLDYEKEDCNGYHKAYIQIVKNKQSLQVYSNGKDYKSESELFEKSVDKDTLDR